MSIMTNKGQTLKQVSDEFIAGMQQMPSGGPDAEALLKQMVAIEKSKTMPMAVYQHVQNVRNTGYDATTIPLIAKNKINISLVLLDYIAQQSSAIPEFINTMVGLYAIRFYSKFPRKTKLTLEWVLDLVGYGKFVYFRQFYPWAVVCHGKAIVDGEEKDINLFDRLDDAVLYTYRGK